MTIAGRIIRGILNVIKSVFKGLSKVGKEAIPVAIIIVNAIKTYMENPVTGSIIDFILEFVKKQIPGTADDILIDKIKKILVIWLPKILSELNQDKDIAFIEDDEERAKAILDRFKNISPETRLIILHGLSVVFATKLSEGELDLSKSAMVMEGAYKHPELLNG